MLNNGQQWVHWAKQHVHWKNEYLQKLLFSDELWTSMFGSDGISYAQRRTSCRGSRFARVPRTDNEAVLWLGVHGSQRCRMTTDSGRHSQCQQVHHLCSRTKAVLIGSRHLWARCAIRLSCHIAKKCMKWFTSSHIRFHFCNSQGTVQILVW